MYIKLVPLRDIPQWATLGFTQIIQRDSDNVLCAVVECAENEPEAILVPGDESMLPDIEYDALHEKNH